MFGTIIQSKAEAKWAIKTASECVLELIDAIPGSLALENDEPSFKALNLQGFYKAFEFK